MSGKWIEVEQGQCVESLAYQAGHVLDTLWNHPNNADLKRQRESPYALMPADKLFIPALEARSERCGSGQRHRFRRRQVPSQVVIALSNGKELADLPFRLQLGERTLEGRTDAQGRLRMAVMPDAADGELLIDPDGMNLRFTLSMRHLDPVSEHTGVQGRLRNLGFYDGPLDGLYSLALLHAIQRFQESRGLTPDGSLDDGLRQALLAAHGG